MTTNNTTTALQKIHNLVGELTEEETYQAAKMLYGQLPTVRQADLINECVEDYEDSEDEDDEGAE